MPDLVITGIGLPPASIRGVTQTLRPIDAASQSMRTVNGTLRDLSASAFRKYASTIACRDQVPPALSGVWPGALVTVECIAELVYETATGSPERPVVASRVDGDFTFYRPLLSMRVLGFSVDHDEWGAAVGWSMEFAEA